MAVIRRLLRSLSAAVTAAASGMLCGGAAPQIPGWVTLQIQRQSVTVHIGDEIEAAEMSLGGGRLTLSGEGIAYASDSAWLVADCILCDIDRDGTDNAVLHVWKKGSFGQYRPFWIEEDDSELWSEHIFIYRWDREKEKRLVPIWMSSSMPVTGRTVFADEKNNLHILSADGTETVWRWEGWGLKCLT